MLILGFNTTHLLNVNTIVFYRVLSLLTNLSCHHWWLLECYFNWHSVGCHLLSIVLDIDNLSRERIDSSLDLNEFCLKLSLLALKSLGLH